MFWEFPFYWLRTIANSWPFKDLKPVVTPQNLAI